jgi:hypothetical protein
MAPSAGCTVPHSYSHLQPSVLECPGAGLLGGFECFARLWPVSLCRPYHDANFVCWRFAHKSFALLLCGWKGGFRKVYEGSVREFALLFLYWQHYGRLMML